MYKKYIKNVLDKILSTFAIILLLPIYIIISLLIVFIDHNKVIYKQKRTGKGGNIFEIYKFTTFKDNKVTKLGKVLRLLSLDEIPQFINILKGEMSFIGPRPWLIDYYDNMNNNQRKRYDVLPGMTGLAQVNGRNSISIKEKIEYDLKYVDNISFLLDLKIAFKSISVVISKDDNKAKDNIKNEISDLKKMNMN